MKFKVLIGPAALLGGLVVTGGCGTASESPKEVVKEEPQAVAPSSFVEGRGHARLSPDMPPAQARIAAERAAKLAALGEASRRSVEAGGNSVISHFDVVSTTWAKDGKSVEVLIRAPVEKP